MRTIEEDDDEESKDLQKKLQGRKNYITPNGAQKLKDELTHLLKTARPELVKVVSWAASNGDRSENGDYIYGKRKLREIDRRIRFLTKRLDAAEIVDPARQTGNRILFGATVKVGHESGDVKIYQIVGIDETDISRGKVSWISPIAQALLQAQKGDVVILRSPKDPMQGEELEVIDLHYDACFDAGTDDEKCQ